MKLRLVAAASLALAMATGAHANGLLLSPNGTARIGVNDDGSLNANTSGGYIGLGYNFTGQGGRAGFQDALVPGCPCEAWGVSGNGIAGRVGQSVGNFNISVNPSSSGTSNNASGGVTSIFTSSTYLTSLPGLQVTQTFSVSNQNGSGALFKNSITIHNATGSTITDVRFARAMDWDVPPTEFREYVTFKGTTTTASLLRSTDDGFANANPLTNMSNGGIVGPINADGITGPADHGSLFIFGFGSLAAGADKKFNIFYGAAGNETGALGLLSAVAPELYSLGQSNAGGFRRDDLPTYIFAFNGVGGSVVVPGVPEPSTWAMMLMGFFGLALATRRRREALAA